MKAVATILLALTVWVSTVTAAHGQTLVLDRPVDGAEVKGFRVGPEPWSPGHRGVDLSARAGERVRAAADGVVSFAGNVAGRPSVSVDHGGIRTTYTPVRPSVAKGQRVSAGQPIGTVVPGHCETACLHWGLTDGDEYWDPMQHLRVRSVALLPLGTQPRVVEPITLTPAPGALPVEGRISSRYGMRTHPVTGVYKLHDGTDIAASCGTPVRVPWAGRVTTVQNHPAYGIRVIVDHGTHRSAYAHLQHAAVSVGEQPAAGAVVGRVGSTGLSTGCHLHWMAWRHGDLVDPMSLVSQS